MTAMIDSSAMITACTAGSIVLLAGAVLLIVLLAGSGRKRDERLAAYWDWMISEAARRTGDLAYASEVYQKARRGSKAVIYWENDQWGQDTWFWHWYPKAGSYVLIRGSRGWGPHNRNANVFYLQYGQVLAVAPNDAPRARRRHQQHLAKIGRTDSRAFDEG